MKKKKPKKHKMKITKIYPLSAKAVSEAKIFFFWHICVSSVSKIPPAIICKIKLRSRKYESTFAELNKVWNIGISESSKNGFRKKKSFAGLYIQWSGRSMTCEAISETKCVMIPGIFWLLCVIPFFNEFKTNLICDPFLIEKLAELPEIFGPRKEIAEDPLSWSSFSNLVLKLAKMSYAVDRMSAVWSDKDRTESWNPELCTNLRGVKVSKFSMAKWKKGNKKERS